MTGAVALPRSRSVLGSKNFRPIYCDTATYTPDTIEASYVYRRAVVDTDCPSHQPHVDGPNGHSKKAPDCRKWSAENSNYANSETLNCNPPVRARVEEQHLRFRTERNLPRGLGVMLVGLGGNNGTTFLAGILANRYRLAWRSRRGVHKANWYGSLMMASTTPVGTDSRTDEPHFCPLHLMLPTYDPADLTVGGWDINGADLGEAMRRSAVLDIELQDQLYEEMSRIRPLPGVFNPTFIAPNQASRADNVLKGTNRELVDRLRADIRNFRENSNLEKVIVLWTANTERFCVESTGVHDTWEHLTAAIDAQHPEVSPSTLYAVASLLENCHFINGSPQNTCVPGIIELAQKQSLFIGGDDFKTGQTKLKSVLCDFLISSGLKPRSIVSYNHLGNNDGRNLSSPPQCFSKETSKRTVIDDMIRSNRLLYASPEDTPDHTVVIKYTPFVGDSKRALDEYISEIFLGGLHTLTMHNVCEDSLLAAPIMIDLVLLTDLCSRISVSNLDSSDKTFHKMLPILSFLSFLCKSPLAIAGAPVVNALTAQRAAIVNMLRACLGLPAEDHLGLPHRFPNILPCALPLQDAVKTPKEQEIATQASTPSMSQAAI